MKLTSWTYEGDITEATKWLPFARSLMKTLGRTAVAKKIVKPTSDVQIEVCLLTGRIHIKAGAGLYMESGFYTFDTIKTPLDVGTGANCHYNSAVSSLLNTTPDQAKININSSKTGEAILSGENLLDGFRSRSFAYSQKDATSDPEKQAKLRAKYNAMMKVPASVFSGKLRLFVQAKYGSKDLDIAYPEGLQFDLPILTWKGEVFNAVAAGAVQAGIYTTDDYEYFLMQVGGGEARFIKLEPSMSGKRLISMIKAGKFDDGQKRSASVKTRAEALILSTLNFPKSKEEYEASWTTEPGSITYYGWHWEWDGHKGHAVKHEIVPYSGQYANQFTRCELSIQHTKLDDGTHSFSMSETVKESAIAGILTQWLAFCYPFPAEQKLVNACYLNWYPSDAAPFATITAASNVPLYCYLDEKDELQVLRITYDIQVKSGFVNNSNGAFVCYPSSRHYVDQKEYNGLSGPVGVTINGTTIGGEWIKTSSETNVYNEPGGTESAWSNWATLNIFFISKYTCDGTDANEYLRNNGYVNDFHASMTTGSTTTINCNGIPTTKEYYYAVSGRDAGITERVENYPNGREEKFYATIIIPYNNCSAVFVASKQHNYARTKQSGSASKTVLAQMRVGYGHRLCDNTTFVIDEENVDGPINFLWGISGEVQSYQNSNEPASFSETFGLHYNGEYQVLETNSGGLTGGEFPGAIGNYDYFYFGLDDVFIETPDFVAASVTNGYKYNAGYLGWWNGVQEVDYPGSASVGWA